MTDAILRRYDPYKRFADRWVRVRDRTGREYEGILQIWAPEYIILNNGDGLENCISREAHNIVSIEMLDRAGQPGAGPQSTEDVLVESSSGSTVLDRDGSTG